MILRNAIQTPDGTVLVSRHRHDYVEHVDKNGHTYMVDGGLSYLRRNVVKDAPYTELSVYDDGTHETRRATLEWGRNYNKEGKELSKTEYVLIKEMDSDHINKILNRNDLLISALYREVLENELKYREI